VPIRPSVAVARPACGSTTRAGARGDAGRAARCWSCRASHQPYVFEADGLALSPAPPAIWRRWSATRRGRTSRSGRCGRRRGRAAPDAGPRGRRGDPRPGATGVGGWPPIPGVRSPGCDRSRGMADRGRRMASHPRSSIAWMRPESRDGRPRSEDGPPSSEFDRLDATGVEGWPTEVGGWPAMPGVRSPGCDGTRGMADRCRRMARRARSSIACRAWAARTDPSGRWLGGRRSRRHTEPAIDGEPPAGVSDPTGWSCRTGVPTRGRSGPRCSGLAVGYLDAEQVGDPASVAASRRGPTPVLHRCAAPTEAP
jgi:hypothetical protein